MRRVQFLLLATMLVTKIALCEDWKLQPLQTQTRWASLVSPANALPDYPRPQLVRDNWESLNGLWQYAITQDGTRPPPVYLGKILVPYPVESALSGVKTALLPNQWLWYQRSFKSIATAAGNRTLLHFGAVDYQATVYLNDHLVGTHQGGYESFTLDITDFVKTGENDLVIRVLDPTDAGSNPHGKQVLNPRFTRYTAISGIWQTVWLEKVPRTYIDHLTLDSDIDHSRVQVQAILNGPSEGYSLRVVARSGASIVARRDAGATDLQNVTTLNIGHSRLWSPDDPFLYDLQVTLIKEGQVADQVESYFGMRKIEVRRDPRGIDRIFLNNRYTYNLGVLDQGYWPEGLYTAPTDAALRFDIEAVKAMGFNTIRKHVKVEPDRWYYHCDQLGILVWQDMVSPASDDAEAHQEFEREVRVTVENLHNHPSIVTWVLFNEGWGAFDQERVGTWVKSLDPSRLVDAHSGARDGHQFEHWMGHLDPPNLVSILRGERTNWFPGDNTPEDWIGGDLADSHSYPNPMIPPSAPGMARVLGEYGGIGVTIDSHVWNDLGAGWGYVQMGLDQLASSYANMLGSLVSLEKEGLSASIFTQPFDVEDEQNGLMTYDRAVLKIPLPQLLSANARLIPKAENYAASTRYFSADNFTSASEQRRYAGLLEKYRNGSREPGLLRHLALFALLQGDQATATAAGNSYIDQLAQPYSPDTWRFINAATRTTQDRGFSLLQSHASYANAVLGDGKAETVVRRIIRQEEIEKFLSDLNAKPDWAVLEKRVSGKYGTLGAEEVYGQEMLYYLRMRDWNNFGKYCARYFDTAAARSEYPISFISYSLLTHVTDKDVLDTAIKASRYDIETGKEKTPTGYDSYANLLYKVGRDREAIEVEEKAAELSAGRNPEIDEHLRAMRAGKPTWPKS